MISKNGVRREGSLGRIDGAKIRQAHCGFQIFGEVFLGKKKNFFSPLQRCSVAVRNEAYFGMKINLYLYIYI